MSSLVASSEVAIFLYCMSLVALSTGILFRLAARARREGHELFVPKKVIVSAVALLGFFVLINLAADISDYGLIGFEVYENLGAIHLLLLPLALLAFSVWYYRANSRRWSR